MKLKIYLVYDSKAECYGNPMFFENRANALRSWQEAANDKRDERNQIARYPGDFTFFEIGEFDKLSGVFSLYESKVSLGLALEYIQNEVNSVTEK